MRQFTNTLRLTITPEMFRQIKSLKSMNINTSKFMRISIQKELDRIKRGKGLRYDYVLI